jgi:hypothetical protein
MKPDSMFHPASPHGSRSDREQTWRALLARLGRVQRVIETLLSDIQRRAAVFGPPHRPVAPTQLELSRLEAARRLREDIEGTMQGFLDETAAQR